MMAKVEAKVSEVKKELVKDLAEQMKKKTVMIVSVKGLPSAQFQDIKKKIREKARIKVAKKSLIDLALDKSGIKELHELVPYVEDSTAILFSDSDAFEISGILSDEKSPSKAKAGQIAPNDIEVKAGPTELLPGPDISALSAVGLTPKVENGKIAILSDKIIVKEGQAITPETASIMAKLDIIPFEVGITPVAAYMGGVMYKDIKIDKEEVLGELEEKYSRALPFAVEIAYVGEDTLDYIFGKAKSYEGVLSRVVSGEPEPVAAPVEDNKAEEKVETKAEEPKAESAEGLASLF